MGNRHKYQFHISIFLLFLFYSPCYAQKWVDMGTKADNGAPMYWSSYDLVKNKKSEWELAKFDTLIGAETSWSLENGFYSPVDIAGNKLYDVATKSLGSPYRMPSQREFDRLISNCDVSFYSVKVKKGYVIKPDINDMSWLYGTWSRMSGGVQTTIIIDKNQLILRAFVPGLDAWPTEYYRGPFKIYMNRIEFNMGKEKGTFWLDISEREVYSYDGYRFRNEHNVRRGSTEVPAKWIDFMQLKSRINGHTLVFPLERYSSNDEYNAIASVSPYLTNNNKTLGWWTSTSARGDSKYIMEVDGYFAELAEVSEGNYYRIRPVYDDGYKNPSTYPNDFGWLQLDVDKFSECGLDIYLDDSLIGQAPYQKELKVKCGSHEVRITGSRIDEIQRDFNVGYHQTCDYHPTITSKYANIAIRSIGCEIQIDGKTVGSYSWSGELEAGTYKVKVTQPCYEPHEETIRVVGGKNETFTITPNRLKKHIFNISCNVGDCKVNIDGKMMNHSFDKPLPLDLEMKTTHTMSLEAPNKVPITISFSIVEPGIIIQSQKGLDSYNGEQSSIVSSDLDGMTVHLSKLNGRLYYGYNTQYKQRPKYDGPIMGVDWIRINGFTLGSEIAWRKEYYTRSRVVITGSLGLALTLENIGAMLIFGEMPECFVGVGVGWQMLRGAGLRVTPQIEVKGLIFEPRATLYAKMNVAYPINDRFVVGIVPQMSLLSSEEFASPDANRNTYYGVSLYLGWQKR